MLSANDNGSFAYAGQDIDMADDAADDATNDGNNDMSALRARIAELESETERIWEVCCWRRLCDVGYVPGAMRMAHTVVCVC